MRGSCRYLPRARSHALSRSRCFADLTTAGLAPSKSIRGSAEFDHVAGRNAAGCAMKEIAIDHGAKLGCRQGSISPHQIPDFKATVFANGLQGCYHMGNIASLRERQQHPLICDDASMDIIDV